MTVTQLFEPTVAAAVTNYRIVDISIMVLTVQPKITVAVVFIAETERSYKVQKMYLVRTAVTEHHSPSQRSEVQLNTPPWHTLEKVRRRIRWEK